MPKNRNNINLVQTREVIKLGMSKNRNNSNLVQTREVIKLGMSKNRNKSNLGQTREVIWDENNVILMCEIFHGCFFFSKQKCNILPDKVRRNDQINFKFL